MPPLHIPLNDWRAYQAERLRSEQGPLLDDLKRRLDEATRPVLDMLPAAPTQAPSFPSLPDLNTLTAGWGPKDGQAGLTATAAPAAGTLSLPDLATLTRGWGGQDAPIEPNGAASPYSPTAAPAAGWGAATSPAVPPSAGSGTPAAMPLPGPARQPGRPAAYTLARQAGLDDEGARIIDAVVETEGGWGGALGDQGQSHGALQFHERGELPGFAAWLGVPIEQARQMAQDPALVVRYASQGYLGSAIAEGRRQGLTGADLATFVQRHGQRSVSPETTGVNYTRLYGGGQQSAAPVQAPAPADVSVTGEARVGAPTDQYTPPSSWRQQYGDNLVPNQIDETTSLGLPWDAAIATCGIAAAVAFARANGRNPTFKEALDLAQRSNEWNQEVGMTRGTAGQIALLDRLGVKATSRGVDEAEIARTVQSGQPVQINAHGSGGHFYVATAYNPRTRQFYFGDSARILKNSKGQAWFRLDELPSLGVGTPSEAIYLVGAT